VKTNSKSSVFGDVGNVGSFKKLCITVVIILTPFIAYYAFMLGAYAADKVTFWILEYDLVMSLAIIVWLIAIAGFWFGCGLAPALLIWIRNPSEPAVWKIGYS